LGPKKTYCFGSLAWGQDSMFHRPRPLNLKYQGGHVRTVMRSVKEYSRGFRERAEILEAENKAIVREGLLLSNFGNGPYDIPTAQRLELRGW